MAEIYSSSEASSHSFLSPEAADHVNSVLSDLGLSGPPATATEGGIGGDTGAAPVDDGGRAPAMPPAETGEFRISGLGDDTLAAGDTGNPLHDGARDAAPPAAFGNDGTPGGPEGGAHPAASSPGTDTLAGGNGMDTLWGSEAPNHPAGGAGHADIHGGAAGGETIPAGGGGIDTLHGAHAAVPDAGDPALLHAGGDTLQAHGSHDTLDGSASTHGSTIDVSGSHATIIGGSGNDTLARHDDSGTQAWNEPGAAGDHAFAPPPDGHATLPGGAGSDHMSSWSAPDGTIGGDGSDIYAMSHHPVGYDTTDAGGASGDGSAFHDPAYATAHFAPDGVTVVTFGDGYGAGPAGIGNIQFHDTVYNI